MLNNPKIMITRDFKSQKGVPKADYLNAHQKKEFQKMLIEKYTKLYGLSCPAVVVEEVGRFFASGVALNSQNLLQLETQIKKAVLQHKSISTKPPAAPAQAPRPPAPPAENVNPNVPEQTGPILSAADPDDEDAARDWDSLGVYQAYVLKQEQELDRKRKQLENKAIRSQLEAQISDKRQREQVKQDEHASYVRNEQAQLEKHRRQMEQEETRRREEKRQIFEMQTKMINQRQAQLKQERDAEDEVNRKIKQSIEQDLATQKQIQLKLNEEKRQEMVKVREENDARKEKKRQQEEKERLEEIELQKLSDKLAQELENQRNAELKAKADQIQQMMVMGEKVVRNQLNKNAEEEAQINKYIERKNRALDRKEKLIEQKEKENKAKYRQFLDQQMREKEAKLRDEKGYIREQADIWRQEDEFYAKLKDGQAARQQSDVCEYRRMLDAQIREKEEKARRIQALTMPDQEKMKEALLEQIRAAEAQKELLNQQLGAL